MMNGRHADDRGRSFRQLGFPLVLQSRLDADGSLAKASQPPLGKRQEWLRLIDDDRFGCRLGIENPLNQPAGASAQIDDQSAAIQSRREQAENHILNYQIVRMNYLSSGIVADG